MAAKKAINVENATTSKNLRIFWSDNASHHRARGVGQPLPKRVFECSVCMELLPDIVAISDGVASMERTHIVLESSNPSNPCAIVPEGVWKEPKRRSKSIEQTRSFVRSELDHENDGLNALQV